LAGNDFYGTADSARRLLGATGVERDALMSELFGELAGGDQAERTMYETSSGLIVPESVVMAPDPTENWFVYLTTEEIFGRGQTLSMAAIIDNVETVSLETTLAWCASWVAKLHHPGRTKREVDSEFIDTHLDGTHRVKIENLLRDPRAVLLAPQTFVVIAKIALEHCERRGAPPPNDEDVRPLVVAALALPTHLTEGVDEVAEDDLVVDIDAGPMGPYLVANQIFNNAPEWRTAWAVYQRCLRELSRELSKHPRVVDFEAAYLDATGVPLDDLVTVCAVVWSRTISGQPSFDLNYFDALKWDRVRLDAVLDLVSASPETLCDLLRREANTFGVLWSTKTFDQFPIVRWEEGYFTVLHPAWVVNRSTGLWPLMDVRRELERRGEAAKASRIAGSVEHTYEHFALEAIGEMVGTKRMYRDDDLRRAYGKKGKVADAAIDYGTSWVVVEVTTPGFRLKTLAGVSPDSLAQDIDDIVNKARQAEATIDNLRRDEAALTGYPAVQGRRRFYPVVVIASRFAGNPITFTMLRERLKQSGVLQANDCAPLEVLQFEDLLAMEGATEKYGFAFLDMLAEKARIERPLVPMLEFLSHKFGHSVPLPDRVYRSWKGWMDTAIERLREASGTEDAPVAEPPAGSPRP
jgi:hypothetical protein